MGDVDVPAVLAAVDADEDSPPREEREPIDARVVARVRAVRLFARTAYARGVFGEEPSSGEPPAPSLEECDRETSREFAEAGA
jgi:hypothetical protein